MFDAVTIQGERKDTKDARREFRDGVIAESTTKQHTEA